MFTNILLVGLVTIVVFGGVVTLFQFSDSLFSKRKKVLNHSKNKQQEQNQNAEILKESEIKKQIKEMDNEKYGIRKISVKEEVLTKFKNLKIKHKNIKEDIENDETLDDLDRTM